MRRFVIHEIREPKEKDIDDDIEWLCRCLGILSNRDFDKTSTKLFESFLEASKKNRALSSDDLADRIGISRATVIHHIKRFESAGVVIRSEEGYELRTHSVQEVLDEIEMDIERTLKRMKKIAEDIDREMGLKGR
jgi:biotin operon repressor